MGFKVGDRVLVDGELTGRTPGNAWTIRLAGYDTSSTMFTENEFRPWTERPPEPVTEFWKEPGEAYRIMSDGSVQQGAGHEEGQPYGIKWVPAEEPQEVLCRYIRALVKR